MLNKPTMEIPGLAITGARYLLDENLARRVNEGKPIGLRMAVVVASDIIDGMLLRHFNADTPIRRVADGAVDHASMARVGYAISKKYPEATLSTKLLTARAIGVGALNLLHYTKTKEVKKGRNKQRLTNLATAAFAVVATKGNEPLTNAVGLVANGVAYTTAPAHLRNLGQLHNGVTREL